MRPERIIVGEVRGGEALDMLQAMNTGHDGSLSTGHANSTKDMLSRLETMVLQGRKGFHWKQSASRSPRLWISSFICPGFVIRAEGPWRSQRYVVYENGEIVLNPLYVFEEDETSTLQKVSGHLVLDEK